ncbi:MAG TPA: ATP-binding protein, partial [Burkholderiales bacterium]|nr:ATP-binding protein [Burkholderiales bacterium]
RHIRCNQMLEGMLGSPEPDAHMPALLERLSLSPAEFVETLTRSPMLVRHFDTSMGRHYEARIAAVIFRAKAQAYICVLIDRSAARKAEEEIRALNTNLAREVAERSAINADMETFVYSVSHDLRAPLRAVTGFSHILEQEHKEALNEEARFLLQKISSGANNMRQLIDGLLSYARLGRAHVSRAPFDMRTLVEEVVQQVREESGLHATQVNVGDLPSVSGDRALVAQVWKNLIDNAFKFSSKQDAPRVEISASTIEDECIYRVQDNGVGFDARFVDRLFGVFQRLHKQSEFEGTGVGLAIAQRIVHKHGGHMSAEAKEGEGAIFSFSLPLRPPRN